MNGNGMVELVKKYDRAAVAIIVSVGSFIAVYIAIGNKIDALVEGSTPIKELRTFKAVQENINQTVEKKLDQIIEFLYNDTKRRR